MLVCLSQALTLIGCILLKISHLPDEDALLRLPRFAVLLSGEAEIYGPGPVGSTTSETTAIGKTLNR